MSGGHRGVASTNQHARLPLSFIKYNNELYDFCLKINGKEETTTQVRIHTRIGSVPLNERSTSSSITLGDDLKAPPLVPPSAAAAVVVGDVNARASSPSAQFSPAILAQSVLVCYTRNFSVDIQTA